MESFGISYLQEFGALLCMQHGHCVKIDSIESHLRRLHGAKGSSLAVALDEIWGSGFVFKNPQDIIFEHWKERPAVKGLPIHQGYQCALNDCVHGKDSLTGNRKAVVQHQYQLHAVGRGKPNKREHWMIIPVRYQNLFDRNTLFQPFVVTDSFDVLPKTASNHPISSPQARLTQVIETKYTSSQSEWKQTFEQLPTVSGLNESQTPPWIKQTGIANYLGGFNKTKSDLQNIIRPIETSKLILHAVYLKFY